MLCAKQSLHLCLHPQGTLAKLCIQVHLRMCSTRTSKPLIQCRYLLCASRNTLPTSSPCALICYLLWRIQILFLPKLLRKVSSLIASVLNSQLCLKPMLLEKKLPAQSFFVICFFNTLQRMLLEYQNSSIGHCPKISQIDLCWAVAQCIGWF